MKNNQFGFSLLEVMFAASLLVLVIGGSTKIMTSYAKRYSHQKSESDQQIQLNHLVNQLKGDIANDPISFDQKNSIDDNCSGYPLYWSEKDDLMTLEECKTKKQSASCDVPGRANYSVRMLPNFPGLFEATIKACNLAINPGQITRVTFFILPK